jgi:hypothetical protein
MITTPQAPPALLFSRASARRVPRAPRPAWPFVSRLGAYGPATEQRIRPPASAWAADADARAGAVLAAYRRAGGLASGDEVTFMMRRRTSQPIAMLARWIVERSVVSFAWHGDYVLPMFQFDRSDMTVRPAVSAVLDEFDGTFDDWDLTTWFALPNSWLADVAPIDVLDGDAGGVLQAARADRFIARG